MKPRWLAFALTLPTDDVLFVQYTVPTIVMSRQCDQHSKVPRNLSPRNRNAVLPPFATLPVAQLEFSAMACRVSL